MLKKIGTRVYHTVNRIPVLILPILWFIFSVLLVTTNAIPDRLVKQPISDGIAKLTQEGDHPWTFFTPQSQLDNFTDKIRNNYETIGKDK